MAQYLMRDRRDGRYVVCKLSPDLDDSYELIGRCDRLILDTRDEVMIADELAEAARSKDSARCRELLDEWRRKFGD